MQVLPNDFCGLESLEVFSPLGIRYWDPVLDQQVKDSLLVSAWPSSKSGISNTRAVDANRSRSGIYAFSHLPGITSQVALPSDRKDFVVFTRDLRERYLSTAFCVKLPLDYLGIYPQNPLPSGGQPKGVLLVSSPTRKVPPSMAAVYGSLWDAHEDRPAAHARVLVSLDNNACWNGVADERGRVAVVFPYPDLPTEFASSPSLSGAGNALLDGWTIKVEVFYEPSRVRRLSVPERPEQLRKQQPVDIATVLDQQKAEIWLSRSPLEIEDSYRTQLRFGHEVVLRTYRDSRLWVACIGSIT